MTFALWIALAAVVAVWLARRNQSAAEDRFEALSRRVASQVAARMTIHEFGVRGARGAFAAAGQPGLDRQRFHDYSDARDLDHEFPGALGFGVIRRVAPAHEASFVAAARADGQPDFAIRQLQPHPGDRYVVEYAEPAERNRAEVGLDVASESTLRAAAQAAMRSGVATLTTPIALEQATGTSARGFLLMLPIYRPGARPTTSEEREAATIGWTYAAVVIDAVLRGLDDTDGGYTLALRDVASPAPEPFFTATPRPQANGGPSRQLSIPIFGRTWKAELHATAKFLYQPTQRSPTQIALVGALLAVLSASLVLLLAQRADSQHRLCSEQARRAAIVEGSADAIIGESLDGIVTDWNRGAERLFGYPAALAMGRPAASLVLPPDRAAEDAEIRDAIARGAWLAPFDSTRRQRDGTLVDVSVTVSPIHGPGGRCVGLSTTVRDISEARRAQQALADLNASLEQQVEHRTALLDAAARDLRTIVDALPSMISYWDRQLNNRFANRAHSAWLEVEPGAMRGHHLRELLGEALFERNRPHIEAALRGEPQTFERSILKADGSGVRHALAHYLPDVVDGAVNGFYVLVHDITEQVESRTQLVAAQRDNRALLETIQQQAIVSVTDRSGCILEVSDSFCQISGYTRAELVGQTHRVVHSGAQDPKLWVDMWRTVASGRPWRGEVCNRAKDGSLYWVDSIIAPFLGGDGRIEKYISIRTDTTARKRAEHELVETSNLLRAVLNAASEVSIIATTVHGVITVFNRGAERLLGYDQREMLGCSTLARIHLDDEVAARGAALSAELGEPVAGLRVLMHSAERAGAKTGEWTYLRKDGSQVPVSLTMTAIRDECGELVGYLAVAHDVSRTKAHERSLREAMHKAEAASRAKSHFLANMSHEIRTPMNAVIGVSYLLERTRLDPEQASFVAKIKLAGKSLLAIINDVLDLSKIEAAELTIERAPFRLRALLSDVSDLMAVQAAARAVAFEIDLSTDLPVIVEGDATRLHQVLCNLLSNAIKFTPRGLVRLTVAPLSAAAGAARLRFTVQDTGIGIAPEALTRVFSRFSQADDSTTRRFGGTGLGLAIVKQLVGLMGGEVGVSSTPGLGSEFTVELELPICADTALAPDPAGTPDALASLPGVRVLVADDNAVNLEIVQRIVELEGGVVRLARNGQEAIDVLLAEPDSIDVVLMDIHMPVLDGHDAARRIRSGLGLARLPIIALTAGTLSSDLLHAEAAGINDFVSKPFDPKALVQCIARHVVTAAVARDHAGARAAPDAWPVIEGITAADASRHLSGDLELFRRMLGRMFVSFADLGASRVANDADLDELGARMHSLRGTTGALGASSIYRLASEAETACRARDSAVACQLVQLITQQLDGLQRSAQSVLADTPAVAVVEVDGAPAAVEPEALAALLQLLYASDLDAVERFTALSVPLRHSLGGATYAALSAQLQDLQFADAARVLEALVR